MKRVAIIGCGGSGKTTIGRQIADLIKAPITHLDAVYYDDDWSTAEPERFTALQEDLVAADRWVIDGNYASTLPIRLKRADTVIFLDLPAVTCLWGIAQRRWRYRGGQHDTIGVYDRITWSFITYVWGYRRQMAPRIRQLIGEHAQHADVRVVTSRRAANHMLLQLKGRKTAPIGARRHPRARPRSQRGIDHDFSAIWVCPVNRTDPFRTIPLSAASTSEATRRSAERSRCRA